MSYVPGSVSKKTLTFPGSSNEWGRLTVYKIGPTKWRWTAKVGTRETSGQERRFFDAKVAADRAARKLR